ncbi:MAG: AmpG family muropeptide MFS transporter [Magnetospirillum sp. WYHS-4]
MTGWADAFRIYLDRRILTVFLLGFSSGLPLALTGATLAVRLTEAGVSLAAVGLFALVGLPYTFKFLWAPIMDRAGLPILTPLFGRRRGWMLATQGALIAALLALGGVDPAGHPWETAALALLVAFCSASQDIVVDAYRVEILDEAQYGAGAAAVQFGYRLAMLASGAGALWLADAVPWPTVYAAMAALVGVGVATVLVNREPTTPLAAIGHPRSFLAWTKDAFGGPFLDMIRRHGKGVALILVFVVLYKFGDAMAGVMANPFYVKIGFTKSEIASVSKVFGFFATILGTALGGVLVAKLGIFRSLLVCGVLQAASNLMFAAQAVAGADLQFLIATIGIENLSGGMGSAAFVAYISRLCNIGYTGTQYALLSSLAALGRTGLASWGGFLAESLGWVDFFLLSTLAALPGIALIWWVRRV